MPYKTRKAPNRDLYWVVAIDGTKKSKEPLPLERAKAQMRALYAAEGRKKRGKGTSFSKFLFSPNEEVQGQLESLKKSPLLLLEDAPRKDDLVLNESKSVIPNNTLNKKKKKILQRDIDDKFKNHMKDLEISKEYFKTNYPKKLDQLNADNTKLISDYGYDDEEEKNERLMLNELRYKSAKRQFRIFSNLVFDAEKKELKRRIKELKNYLSTIDYDRNTTEQEKLDKKIDAYDDYDEMLDFNRDLAMVNIPLYTLLSAYYGIDAALTRNPNRDQDIQNLYTRLLNHRPTPISNEVLQLIVERNKLEREERSLMSRDKFNELERVRQAYRVREPLLKDVATENIPRGKRSFITDSKIKQNDVLVDIDGSYDLNKYFSKEAYDKIYHFHMRRLKQGQYLKEERDDKKREEERQKELQRHLSLGIEPPANLLTPILPEGVMSPITNKKIKFLDIYKANLVDNFPEEEEEGYFGET